MRYRNVKEWVEFVNGSHCGLCGNTGFVDTRISAITPAGRPVGVRRYCICPNGRCLKKTGGTQTLTVALMRGSENGSK